MVDFIIPGDGIVLDTVTVLEVCGMIPFSGTHFTAPVIGVQDLVLGVAVLHTARDGAGVTVLATDLDMAASVVDFTIHTGEEVL